MTNQRTIRVRVCKRLTGPFGLEVTAERRMTLAEFEGAARAVLPTHNLHKLCGDVEALAKAEGCTAHIEVECTG